MRAWPTSTAASARGPVAEGARSGRLRAMRVLAAIMAVSAVGFGVVTVVVGILVPAQAPHAYHNVIVASLLLIVSAPPVIAVARAPEAAIRPLVVLAVVGVAGLATMAAARTLDPFTLPFIILVAVLWAVLPDRSRPIPTGRPSPILARTGPRRRHPFDRVCPGSGRSAARGPHERARRILPLGRDIVLRGRDRPARCAGGPPPDGVPTRRMVLPGWRSRSWAAPRSSSRATHPPSRVRGDG